MKLLFSLEILVVDRIVAVGYLRVLILHVAKLRGQRRHHFVKILYFLGTRLVFGSVFWLVVALNVCIILDLLGLTLQSNSLTCLKLYKIEVFQTFEVSLVEMNLGKFCFEPIIVDLQNSQLVSQILNFILELSVECLLFLNSLCLLVEFLIYIFLLQRLIMLHSNLPWNRLVMNFKGCRCVGFLLFISWRVLNRERRLLEIVQLSMSFVARLNAQSCLLFVDLTYDGKACLRVLNCF